MVAKILCKASVIAFAMAKYDSQMNCTVGMEKKQIPEWMQDATNLMSNGGIQGLQMTGELQKSQVDYIKLYVKRHKDPNYKMEYVDTNEPLQPRTKKQEKKYYDELNLDYRTKEGEEWTWPKPLKFPVWTEAVAQAIEDGFNFPITNGMLEVKKHPYGLRFFSIIASVAREPGFEFLKHVAPVFKGTEARQHAFQFTSKKHINEKRYRDWRAGKFNLSQSELHFTHTNVTTGRTWKTTEKLMEPMEEKLLRKIYSCLAADKNEKKKKNFKQCKEIYVEKKKLFTDIATLLLKLQRPLKQFVGN